MKSGEAYRLGNRYPDVLFIDSAASGLRYAVDGERRGLVIAGQAGKTGLNLSQVRALHKELGEIMRVYLDENQ